MSSRIVGILGTRKSSKVHDRLFLTLVATDMSCSCARIFLIILIRRGPAGPDARRISFAAEHSSSYPGFWGTWSRETDSGTSYAAALSY